MCINFLQIERGITLEEALVSIIQLWELQLQIESGITLEYELVLIIQLWTLQLQMSRVNKNGRGFFFRVEELFSRNFNI